MSLSEAATIALIAGILIIILLVIIQPRIREKLNSPNPSSEISALSELGTAIATTPAHLGELAEVAYVEAAHLFEMDFFQLGLFEDDRYRTLFWMKDGKLVDNEEFLLSNSSGIVSWIHRSNQPLRVNDFIKDADTLPAQPSFIMPDLPASGIFAPLLIGEESIGVISVQNRKSNSYSEDHLRLLTILANNLSGPVALSLLNSEIDFIKQQVIDNEEISRTLASSRSLEDKLSDVVSLIQQSTEYVGVKFYEYKNGDLSFLTLAPEDPQPPEVDASLIQRVLSGGKSQTRYHIPLMQKDVEQNTVLTHVSELAVPITIEDQPHGVLQMLQIGNAPFSTIQRSQAEAVAANIALAILESQVDASQQEENWFTTVLLEIARHAAQPGDMESALQAVLQLTTILTGTAWTMLFIRDRTQSMFRMGPSAGISRQTQLMLSEVRISMDSLGMPYTKPGATLVEIELPDPLSSLLNTSDATAVALGSEKDPLGVFILERKKIPDRQISLIMGIANQISLRLENYKLIEEVAARRSLERELETARTIQESFLPREIPTYAGWEIGVNWGVARQVGGDFYDFIPLEDGPDGKRWGIVIADVTDKGIPAALFMALSRTLLRSVAINRVDPGETLTRVNQLIFADTQSELLVSLIYSLWEPEVSRLSFANAGHNPPLLFKPFQPAQILSDHGIVAGATLDTSYTTQSLTLKSGELMVFYTDGVTEAMDPSGEMFGVHRLENLVLGLRHWSGQGVADQITKRVADFCGSNELQDDLTTVILYNPDTN